MGVLVALGQDAQPIGLFERAQVATLEILDEGQLHDLGVCGLPHDTGHFGQAGFHGGAVASLTGDDLESPSHGPHEDRFDNALFADRRHQLGQVAHGLARLMGIGHEVLDGNQTANGDPSGSSELLDEVAVVSHPQGFRQADAAGARHVR